MLKYVAKRLLYMVFVFFIMSFVMFFLYNLIPGDPAMAQLEAMKDKVDPVKFQMMYESLRKSMGLDDPIFIRYVRWFWGILHLDFGVSIKYKDAVIKFVGTPLNNTVLLNIFVTILSLGITIPLGIKCAVKKDSFFDSFVQVTTIIGYSIPSFIFALLAIYVFCVELRWFPVSGMQTPQLKGGPWIHFLDKVWHLIVPIFVLTLSSLGGMTRYVRSAMVECLREDYIRTARAKGLREKVVIYSHAWRNALLPVITLIIGWFMSIFSGSIVIENMFSLNGMGKLYYVALNAQDYNVALFTQLFYMILSLLGNLLVDLSYGLVDPRVRITK